MRQRVIFGEYAPDVAALRGGTEVLTTAKNVRPYAGGYLPQSGLTVYSNALAARCNGYTSFKRRDGNSLSFGSTTTKLYYLAGPTFADRSKGGGYTVTTRWEFAQFGTLAIAAALGSTPQKWDLTADPDSGATLWADLGGSPPQFRHIAVYKNFVIGGYEVNGGTTYEKRLRWAALGNAEDWTPAPSTTMSDVQDLADGGEIRKVVGASDYAAVFQERSITRLVFIGIPGVFQIDKVADSRGTIASGSVVSLGGLTYYLDDDGFQVFNGNLVQGIGEGKVNRTFLNDVNLTWASRISAGIDPINKLVMWAYVSKNNNGNDPDPDKIIVFNYAENRWTTVEIGSNIELLASGLTEAMTLDNLGTLFATVDDIYPALDDPFWLGGQRYVAAFNTAHKLAYFTGTPLGATLETGELNFGGAQRAIVSGVWPLVDGGAASVSLGTRELQSGSVAYDTATAAGTDGKVPKRSASRYHRLKVTTAAGTDFTRAIGCEVEVQPGGMR